MSGSTPSEDHQWRNYIPRKAKAKPVNSSKPDPDRVAVRKRLESIRAEKENETIMNDEVWC